MLSIYRHWLGQVQEVKGQVKAISDHILVSLYQFMSPQGSRPGQVRFKTEEGGREKVHAFPCIMKDFGKNGKDLEFFFI